MFFFHEVFQLSGQPLAKCLVFNLFILIRRYLTKARSVLVPAVPARLIRSASLASHAR